MVQQTLYSIEFFDNERKFMPYCYFELSVNGNLVTGLPPRADSQGKVWINKQWVESMASAPKELVVSFWNTEFPKTQHSETEKFIWPEGKTSIKAFLPDVYTINTRPLANENNEEQAYQRAYYLVRKGDTWERLEAELGVNTVEALILHNRMSYSDQLVEGAKLYYPLGFRTRNEMGSNTAKKKTTEKEEEPKQSEAKQEKTIEQRSQANGKPEEVAKPKEDGCFCYRDFTVEEFKSIILEMRKFSKNPYKNLFYEKNCPLPEDDKSFERLTEEINKSFNAWEINTCMRKIQFLAQCYHESASFSTTLEFASGEYYNPPNPKKPEIKTHGEAISHQHKVQGDGPRYKGRGIIQQTWRDTQITYYKNVVKRFPNYFLNKKIDESNVEKELFNRNPVYTEIFYSKKGNKEYKCDYASLIARDLFLSCDSAGWFWGLYKTRFKKTLNYISDFGVYGNGTITWMVHGGGNTISIRLNLYRHLRDKVFDYSNKCINKINHIKKDELLSKDILKQKSYWGEVKDDEY
ncbi:LysM peptidoglycan-binding domain-containing protein [Aggregatibacter actinomycetemcomitans]|uniref:LysM peptidoglycan-binding domain-containing protein n=1 Tax=Aggregatibacter actinomycetemcomitans TaxID=714 RepID=UPI00197B3CD7|nr:LysM peptidoglycan-binding domain-containing protein [Aggregatibacter actinomycetemcomitans]MBN6063290.1 LysM peptidoglycan-binding domain-containing protein [Aggregatibacter actinomycetemcomitans]MBN6083234.1 LysM peptidoglycan-binding domain-containing protein [Aggregatibacter actinomycetemcomitans]